MDFQFGVYWVFVAVVILCVGNISLLKRLWEKAINSYQVETWWIKPGGTLGQEPAGFLHKTGHFFWPTMFTILSIGAVGMLALGYAPKAKTINPSFEGAQHIPTIQHSVVRAELERLRQENKKLKDEVERKKFEKEIEEGQKQMLETRKRLLNRNRKD